MKEKSRRLKDLTAYLQVRPILQRGGSSASLHNTSLRNTIFQLMIHTLDPLGEGENFEKVLHSLEPKKVLKKRHECTLCFKGVKV